MPSLRLIDGEGRRQPWRCTVCSGGGDGYTLTIAKGEWVEGTFQTKAPVIVCARCFARGKITEPVF